MILMQILIVVRRRREESKESRKLFESRDTKWNEYIEGLTNEDNENENRICRQIRFASTTMTAAAPPATPTTTKTTFGTCVWHFQTDFDQQQHASGTQ